MPEDDRRWLSLSEASELLGVHFTTLRRWSDAGAVPCFRTPGGHRRFRKTDLERWMEGAQATALVPAQDGLVQSAVGYARQEMAEQGIHEEPWHAAFSGSEDRREMAEMGRTKTPPTRANRRTTDARNPATMRIAPTTVMRMATTDEETNRKPIGAVRAGSKPGSIVSNLLRRASASLVSPRPALKAAIPKSDITLSGSIASARS